MNTVIDPRLLLDYHQTEDCAVNKSLARPSGDLIRSYVGKLDKEEGFATTEAALSKLFQAFPSNTALDEVLLKVTTLNSLYSTRIWAVHDVARLIQSAGIDEALRQGDLEVVKRITKVSISEKERNNYSFATKYCSFHQPVSYPIYDFYVDYLLWEYQKQDGFSRFFRYELGDYPKHHRIVTEFRKYYDLTEFSYKHIDKFLWKYGKEVYDLEKARIASASLANIGVPAPPDI